jgi:uncharacterized protein
MRLPAAVLFYLLLLPPAPAVSSAADPVPDADYPPAIEELTIESEGARMPGLIYLANGEGPHPTVVLLHGFPGNEKNLDLAQALRRAGFNVLFFHYRGAWGAEGSYSVRQLDDDTLAVLAFLRDPANAKKYRVDTAYISLLGHSLGGFTALAAGSRDRGVTCVGAMAPANLGLWKAGFAKDDPLGDRLFAYADGLFMLENFDGAVMRQEMQSASLDELDTRRFGPGLRGKSVLMVVGEEDTVTTPEAMFQPVVDAYESVEGMRLEHHIIPGDHSFSWSRLLLTQLVLDWLERDCRRPPD